MIVTRGRRRQVETTNHCCPHAACASHGRVGFGNIRANGHPHGRRWRPLLCRSCRGSFLATLGTPLHATPGDPDTRGWASAALAEGLGIRAVARVVAVDPNPVLGGWVEAAEHLEACSRYFLPDVSVEQVQMDALVAWLSTVKDGDVTAAEAITCWSRSPSWVWVAMDPVCTLILTVDVGERTLQMAPHPVHQVTHVLAPDGAPRCLTDGVRESLTAFVTHDGQRVRPERRQATGSPPQPRWMPAPHVRYAQVVQSYRRRRLIGVQHRVVVGTREAIDPILAKRGWTITTAFSERLHLDFRPHVAALGRRVHT
jgi:transposase-like protein